MMDNPRLSDAVASLFHKLEPSNLSKYKFPPDLEIGLTKLKDSLPLLLDPSRTHDLSLSTDDLEHPVCRVNDLLDLHFDESSSIVKDDGEEEEEEKRFEELRLLISRLAPLFKSCSEITEFELAYLKRLPPDLFRLVVYCSIYPKGHRFVRETQVNMLMAQDLLRDTLEKYINPDKMPISIVTTYVMPDETTILRDTGKRYFEELLSRGIFEKPVSVFGNGNSRSVYSCEMNPLVCDAARRLAAEEVAVFSTRNSDGSSSVTVGQRTKHVAFHKNGFSRFNLEKVIQNCENTTSLLMFSSHWDAFFGGSAGQIVRLDNLRQLRVLDLSGCQFRKLPPIRLSSLKYLSLLGNVLLESFSCEFFPLLETLDIHGCVRLENVVGLELLSDLRNLYLTSRQSSLNLGFHFLPRVLLEVSHCVHLIDIRGLHVNILRIFDCPSLKTLDIRYGNLEELVLHNCAGLVLDCGKKHKVFFKRLELVGLPMVRLPDWLQFAQDLEYFMIADCPQLRELEDVEHLRSLHELYIYNCPNLRSPLYSHPNLNLLDIRNCPKLTGIPTWLSNIQEVFSAIPSFFRKSSSTGRAKTHKPQSSSESKGPRRKASSSLPLPSESPSKSNVLKVYLDGQIHKYSPNQASPFYVLSILLLMLKWLFRSRIRNLGSV